jgi:hypothetical protein
MAQVVVVTSLMIDKNNCRMATRLQLGYTIGIDNQQLNGNYIVDNF